VTGSGLDVSVTGAGLGVSVTGTGLAVSGSGVVVSGREVCVIGSTVAVESLGGVLEGGGVKVPCPLHAAMDNTNKRINCLIKLTIVYICRLNVHNLL
jgi:hypothetical protein